MVLFVEKKCVKNPPQAKICAREVFPGFWGESAEFQRHPRALDFLRIFERVSEVGTNLPVAGGGIGAQSVHRCGLGWMQKDTKKHIRGCGDEG